MCRRPYTSVFFFFNDTATTEIYTLSLHDALPISRLITAQAAEKPLETIQGIMLQALEGKPALKARGKEFPLSARTSYLLHTLEDKRLAGREVRVEGEPKPDGSFEAWKFFTVRDGKLYRVRYYCQICNIEALEPGRCVCCQR